MNELVSKPPLPKRSKSVEKIFYKIRTSMDSPLGIDIINKEDIIPLGQMHLGANTWRRGFFDLRGRPIFRHNRKNGRLPVDFEIYSGWWIVSERMKQLLEQLDPEACAFLQCDLELADGSAGPSIWLCDVVRMLDAVDEDASDIEVIYWDNGQKRYDVQGRKLIFRSDVLGSVHIFRMLYFTPPVICDDIFRNECKKEKIKGISFYKILHI